MPRRSRSTKAPPKSRVRSGRKSRRVQKGSQKRRSVRRTPFSQRRSRQQSKTPAFEQFAKHFLRQSMTSMVSKRIGVPVEFIEQRLNTLTKMFESLSGTTKRLASSLPKGSTYIIGFLVGFLLIIYFGDFAPQLNEKLKPMLAFFMPPPEQNLGATMTDAPKAPTEQPVKTITEGYEDAKSDADSESDRSVVSAAEVRETVSSGSSEPEKKGLIASIKRMFSRKDKKAANQAMRSYQMRRR